MRKRYREGEAAQLVTHEVDQVGGIAAVEDGEGRVEADPKRVEAQEPRTNGMEGAGPLEIERGVDP